jgi:phosphoglycerol transferase MdoB-like AlkP superfamily enzyme
MSDQSPQPESAGGDKQQISISVDDEIKHGVYANFLVVSHSPHEFTLDFCQILPGGQEGKVKAEVVTRIKVAPTMVGKVIRALNTNMTAYEDKFGMVKEVG